MITKINNTRGRRLLNPIDIANARLGGPEALLAWYDFTDKSTMGSTSSGGVNPPGIGDTVMRIDNKAFNPGGAGAKALGALAHQGDSSKAPLYLVGVEDGPYLGGKGGNSSCLFNGGFLEAVGAASVASTGKFSTTGLDMANLTVYVVCDRLNPFATQREDVFFITSKNHTNQTMHEYCSFFFDEDKKGTFEMWETGASTSYASTKYDTADDGNFRYHMYHTYDKYVNNDNYARLSADGLMQVGNDGGDGLPDPFYDKVMGPGYPGTALSTSDTGTLDTVMELDAAGTYHPSMTIGGQSRVDNTTAATNTFRGAIYEIVIFNTSHVKTTALDKILLGTEDSENWKDMLYYFKRKYQTIGLKR